MTARARFVVLIVMFAGGVASAGKRVASYAYVTAVRSDYASNANQGTKEDHCNVSAQLPLTILDAKPSGPAPELRKDATLVGSREADYDRVCEQWLHTWQPVTFDPDHRDDVEFDLPKSGGLTGSKILWIIIGVILVGVFVKQRYADRWFNWRMQRREAAAALRRKSSDELRERIAAKRRAAEAPAKAPPSDDAPVT